MRVALLIDLGSTHTKVAAVDMDGARLLGRVQAPSTVGTDVTEGLEQALDALHRQTGGREEQVALRLACSSAAGGLRMVALGLVPSLTTEAARRAALGAGAKVIRVLSHQLTTHELRELEAIAPDMVLLAGGTDGGNRETILHNARALAASAIACPIVVAGNKNALEQVEALLKGGGKQAILTENVMPELNTLNVEPARTAIREVFVRHVIHAKGLDRAQSLLDDIVMPTPMAVLEGARLLAQGTARQQGMGDLVLVDVGGATTDVHSIGEGAPGEPRVEMKGLPEPYAKRTVEGDLGLRVNAASVLESARETPCLGPGVRQRLASAEASEWAGLVCRHTDTLPRTPQEEVLDTAMGQVAVHLAVERHAGRIHSLYTPEGPIAIQEGKDLTPVQTVIGTGGIFAYSGDGATVLSAALFQQGEPHSLRPRHPALYIDADYIFYAAGLLATVAPEVALRLLRRSLKQATVPGEVSQSGEK